MRRFVLLLVTVAALVGGSLAPTPVAHSAPTQAPPPPTVKVYGKTGTFGSLAPVTSLASGQSFATQAVPNWNFPVGREFWANAHMSDGTLLVAGGDQHACQACQTSAETAIGAFNPAANTYSVTKLKTTKFDAGGNPVPGIEAPPTPGMVSDTVGDGPEQRGGTSISDITEFDNGNAAAFVAWVVHEDHDVNQHGIWPAFGILTKVDGTWQVATGPGWMNQWTGKELRTSRPEDNVDELACPEDVRVSTTGLPPSQTVVHFPGHSGCAALNELEPLPPSGIPNTYDFVATQYGDDNDNQVPSNQGGALVLRVTGPDAAGRYTTKVMDKITYPLVPDRGTTAPDDYVGISGLSAMVDPTGAATPTDQRFVLNFDLWQVPGNPPQPSVFQELSYNATTGKITQKSAPILPGDVQPNGNPYAFKHVAYGNDGTLYATRFADNFAGGKLAVFPKINGVRPLERLASCKLTPGLPLQDHTTQFGSRVVWGKPCKPYYDIVQPSSMAWTIPEVNPATGDVILTTIDGKILPIRPSGSGTAMSFQVGSPVDTSYDLLGHTVPGTVFMMTGAASGSIDSAGRVWLSVGESRGSSGCENVTYPRYLVDDPATPGNEGALCLTHDALPSNNWLYSIDLDDLFDPPAVALGGSPGDQVGLQAEVTATLATVKRTGTGTDFELDSARYVKACTGPCTYAQTGNGFYLGDDGFGTFLGADWGHRGGPLQYEVDVPSTGCYRLGFFVSTFASSSFANAAITVQAGSNSVTTNVYSSTGGWMYKLSSSNLCFTTAGVQNITVTGSVGQWFLNWFTLERV